jgi:hypothetical protein
MAEIYSLLGERLTPLDRVERLANAREWFVDRSGDDELNMIIAATWGDLSVSLNWRDDYESLHIACSFDMRVPANRREEIGRLITMLNEQLYFGHFDLWRHDGSVMFRNSLLLAGGAGSNDAQCETLISLAVDACERYFPCFQFVIWAGKTAEDALAASLIETVGEA